MIRRTLPTISRRLFLFVLLASCGTTFGLIIKAQVLTNRTPDKAKIQSESKPKPSPTPDLGLITPDPALYPPRTPRPPYREREAEPAYYVTLSRVTRVLVSDPAGRSDDLFPSHGALKVLPLTYDALGSESLLITLPIGETYSITFGTEEPSVFIEILKGRGNASPDEAIRYNDVVIGKGTARLQFTAVGVGPVRLDSNNDGRFESILQPTVHLHGLAAKDTHGPEVKFEVLERNAETIVIAIKVVDRESGVKRLVYSFDGWTDIPYVAPVRVKLKEADLIWGIAEDHAGNQTTAVYEFKKHPGEQ